MLDRFHDFLTKPMLYAPSTGALWDDEHISKGMLEAHLHPNWDAATRKHDFLDQSAHWISRIAPPPRYKFLLDLGCGPGLYAERFSVAGYSVTGLDFSKRSIAYAMEQTVRNKSDIEYHYQNYLTMDDSERFDVVALIYCDYAALCAADRLAMLKKIYRALKTDGKFIFDVFTPRMRRKESHSWLYFEQGGFWNEKPHICLESVYQYNDEDQTELRQSIVLTDETVHCYNVWDHFFTKETLLSEARTVPFKAFEFYGDVAGKAYADTGETICGVFTK